jgi:hypothetical protein
MPAKSKAQLRWAYANRKKKGSTGAAAREMAEKTKTARGLPSRKKGY